MPTVTKSLGDGTQSVLLTVAIFERLERQPEPIGVSELARDIGTSKSRVFRHLQTLAASDYIVSREDGEYEIGAKLIAFCRTIGERYDLVGVASEIMFALRERLGHAVIISRVDPAGVHVLKSISGNSPIEVGIRAGTTLPYSTSAQGKIALAFLASEQQARKAAATQAFDALTEDQRRELETIRSQGWATAQMRQGLKGMAAPVFGRGDGLVATLGILDTVHDMGENSDATKAQALVAAARTLSERLAEAGYRAM